MKKGKVTEVAVIPENRPVPMQTMAEQLIAQAIDKSVPVETMEKLLAMRRELNAEAAKKVFDESMAAFQGECPTIVKTKAVPTKAGGLAYKYAPIESIVEQTKVLIQKYGFSYAVKTETTPHGVRSTCIVKHKDGHSEESSMEVPLGNQTQVMSASQVTAAALTFAKRYAFCNAFGIMTGDGDNDGQTDALKIAQAKPVAPKVPSAKEMEERMTIIGRIAIDLKFIGQSMTEKAEQFFRDIDMKDLRKLADRYLEKAKAKQAEMNKNIKPEDIPVVTPDNQPKA